MKITLKDIHVLNEAVELLARSLPHSREATLAPLVKETRDKLVEGYRAQALAETEAALSKAVTPELVLILSPLARGEFGGWAVAPHLDVFVTFDTPRSKVVRRLAYNFETRELHVHFVNGRVWSYLNVPHNVFEEVLLGDGPERSVGKAYNRLLKYNYAYDSALVKCGKRQVETYTVFLKVTGRGSGIRLDTLEVVTAGSVADAYWKAKAKAETWARPGSASHVKTLKGTWKPGGRYATDYENPVRVS